MTKDIKFEIIKCCICDGVNQTKIPIVVGQFGSAIFPVECDCGLVFLNPRWSKHNYDDFYKNHYTSYYSLSPEQMKINTKLILDRLPLNLNPQTVLELGCNTGEGLVEIKNKHPSTKLHGIEMSKDCVEICKNKGIEIIATDFQDSWKGKFDLIVARHVLEHSLDPIKFLKNIKESLSSNGIAYIAVPDQDNPRKVLRDYNDYLQYWYRVVHTYYFNKSTLFKLLTKIGLKMLTCGQKSNELFCIVELN